MKRPAPRPRRQRPATRRPTPPLTPPPLLAPHLTELAARLKGKGAPAARRSRTTLTAPQVPRELDGFFTSPSAEALVGAVRAHTRLYWHPLVIKQIAHLRELWQRHNHPEDAFAAQALEAERIDDDLLRAHVEGSFPGRRFQ